MKDLFKRSKHQSKAVLRTERDGDMGLQDGQGEEKSRPHRKPSAKLISGGGVQGEEKEENATSRKRDSE